MKEIIAGVSEAFRTPNSLISGLSLFLRWDKCLYMHAHMYPSVFL